MGRHTAGVKACSVLADGRLVTGGFDGKVRVCLPVVWVHLSVYPCVGCPALFLGQSRGHQKRYRKCGTTYACARVPASHTLMKQIGGKVYCIDSVGTDIIAAGEETQVTLAKQSMV